mmetsp:Transcript_75901/g.180380  ORF Transcript_75901/g.180380 Transcript_75901/m.180380 type:complete len:1495 (+) Transcript_75901:73-4557(+)
MARRPRGQQRTVLEPLDAPPPGFLQSFKASHNLSRALSLDRKVAGTGQIELLKRGAEQRAWVDAARLRPMPPPEHVLSEQRVLSDMRKHCVSDVLPALERPAQHARRMVKQEAFLDYRRSKHDNAIAQFEQDMKALYEDCDVGVQTAEELFETFKGKAEAKIEKLLAPLEIEGDELGMKSEKEVRAVLSDLHKVTSNWQAEIAKYSKSMDRIEGKRLDSGNSLRKLLLGALHEAGHWVARDRVEMLPEAGHMVEGDIDTVDEVREDELRRVLEERQGAIKVRLAELTEELEKKAADNERRWEEGMLLWRRMRHRRALREVMQRIESTEFDQPENLVQVMSDVQEKQRSAFKTREKLLKEMFSTRVQDLQVHAARAWEEQNNKFNDLTVEAFDNLFAELKEVKDELSMKGEDMLNALCGELERYDARQEWGEHVTVPDLVDADVRPHLQKRLDFVEQLLTSATDALTQQDEMQHHIVAKIITLFQALAKQQESLTRKMHEVEFNYQGELSDHEKDFEDECAENERTMAKYKQDIDDAVTSYELDDFKEQAFEFLDDMAVRYRKHTETVIETHKQYPESASAVFQEELFSFSSHVGLVPESQVTIKPTEDGEIPEDAEPPQPEYKEWVPENGADVGSRILEQQAIPEFRSGVLCLEELLEEEAAPPPVEEPPPQPAEVPDAKGKRPPSQDAKGSRPPSQEAKGAAKDAAKAKGGKGKAAEVVEPPIPEQPIAEEETEKAEPEEEPLKGCAAVLMADKSEALLTIAFEIPWLDDCFVGMREAVFYYLGKWYGKVSGIDVTDDCEAESRKLDQLLRKHTNRKGEVQVEWYVPRYGIVSKHKDKFERHIVAVANKNIAMEKSTDELHQELDAKEAAYKEKLQSLIAKLADCETLPALTALERQAHDAEHRFEALGQEICAKLQNLATKGPQGLQQENDALLKVCKSGAEQFSQREIAFYSGEVDDLNAQLSEKGKARLERLRELEGQLSEKQKLPAQDFAERYAEAVEALSAAKGLGRKHGEQRRKAQERCRTLVSRATSVRHNIETLLNHFVALCSLPVTAVASAQDIPKCSILNMEEFFSSAQQPWVFASELTGILYILVLAINTLSTSVQGYKEAHAPKFKPESMPTICVLQESEVLVPSSDPELLQHEDHLRQECLLRVMGPFNTMDAFNKEIESIVAAGHQAYKDKNVATPDFMLKFFEDMKVSAEGARLDIINGIRQGCNALREEGLLDLGDALFGSFTERALQDLHKHAKSSQSSMKSMWLELDSQRALHEKQLKPGLANPNAEDQLMQLMSEEDARREKVSAQLVDDRQGVATGLRSHADSFVSRLQSNFESVMKLVDSLPLYGQFIELPGEEGVEAPRMSIKRRMRRQQINDTAEQPTDKLPARTWEGFPRTELRQKLSVGSWPVDPELEGKEDLQELTASVESFRSPVHKKLFERRAFYYNRFRAEFFALVQQCDGELSKREEKEGAEERTWQAAVKQLKGETSRLENE